LSSGYKKSLLTGIFYTFSSDYKKLILFNAEISQNLVYKNFINSGCVRLYMNDNEILSAIFTQNMNYHINFIDNINDNVFSLIYAGVETISASSDVETTRVITFFKSVKAILNGLINSELGPSGLLFFSSELEKMKNLIADFDKFLESAGATGRLADDMAAAYNVKIDEFIKWEKQCLFSTIFLNLDNLLDFILNKNISLEYLEKPNRLVSKALFKYERAGLRLGKAEDILRTGPKSLTGIDDISRDVALCVKKMKGLVSPFNINVIKAKKGIGHNFVIEQAKKPSEPFDPFKQAILGFFLNTRDKIEQDIVQVKELNESLVRASNVISQHVASVKETDVALYESYFKRLAKINKAIKAINESKG
jgi:hypothetical protein